MTPDLHEQALRLEALLPRLMRCISPTPEEDPLVHLPLGQLRLVRTLMDAPKTVCQVGEELGLSPSSVSQLVQRLADAGLVEKTDDPDDKRSRLVCLSEEGRRKVERRHLLRVGRVRRLLEALAPEERCRLIDAVQAMTHAAAPQDSVATTAEVEKGYSV